MENLPGSFQHQKSAQGEAPEVETQPMMERNLNPCKSDKELCLAGKLGPGVWSSSQKNPIKLWIIPETTGLKDEGKMEFQSPGK